MFPYRFPTALITSLALAQPQIVFAQDIVQINNIAINVTVKITGYSNGSGVIFEKDGNIYSVVTNQHVVPIDTDYEIRTNDGRKHKVINRKEIPGFDLAIVKFESEQSYQIATMGDSETINPLQRIYVAGFPGEQTDIDLISGEIRSIRQEIIRNPIEEKGYALIYTNQTLPGSSGGAILDEQGRLIGINGEATIDHITGTAIRRGIPINLFLEAKDNINVVASNPELTRIIETEQPLTSPETTVNTSAETNSSSLSPRISSSDGKTIKVWDLKTGKLEKTLIGHDKSVNSVAVAGNYIISSSDDKTIKVWDLKTGKLEKTLIGHDKSVNSVAVAGNYIVSGSRDETIKVWNLKTGKLEKTLIGHDQSVNSVAVTGEQIISGSADNTIKMWRLQN